MLLNLNYFKRYIDCFNANDEETVIQHIDNKAAWNWLKVNIPLFECPEKNIEEVYYFRWWVYRKHIKKTPDGYIITEFHPDVPWAGKYNSIVCPVGHHIYEGRWIADTKYIEDTVRFWYRKGGRIRDYSSWIGEAVWQYCCVKGDFSLAMDLLDDFIADYLTWEMTNLHDSGLFWSVDDRDGGEYSISGNGLRPTLNSYMYGYASVIAKTAKLAGRQDIFKKFTDKAERLRKLINEKLWDPEGCFFKVYPLDSKDSEVKDWNFSSIDPNRNVRELMGYIPWYFNIPVDGTERAWELLMDNKGLYAPYGPTTAEQSHPKFMFKQEHECLWNGPSWPFATSMTITAMINCLNNYSNIELNKNDFINILKIYTNCHVRKNTDGTVVRWVDENIDPFTGEWISRTILEKWGWLREKGGRERGKDYNHSSYCDLIITGLVGLRPRQDNILEIYPLIPDTWNYFCLDNVSYHGYAISVLYDKSGKRYGKGSGIHVFINGKEAAKASSLGRMLIKLC